MNSGEKKSENAPFFVDNEVITLTKNGIWIADGMEISHEPTRRLFAKSLRKRPDGYYLEIGRETKKIDVQDTAYFIHRIDGDPVSGYELWISDETRERLRPETLNYRPGRLVCEIKKSLENGPEKAKFLHAAYFDLLKELHEDESEYYLEFGTARRRIRIAERHH